MPDSSSTPAAATAITKILVPRRRPDVIRRPRLLDILHGNVGQRATVVAAPAGYGKTTLLVDWAHDVDMPVCWLNLAPSEADAGALGEAIIAAIQQQQPGFGLSILAEAKRPRSPEETRSYLVPRLVNEIHDSVDEYLALVLDDFQTVERSEGAVTMVSDLLTWAPENLHVVVISRTRPGLPCLPRLVARREAVVLGPADLAFTIEEIQELLLSIQGQKVSEDEARQLRESTEGWCAALVLARFTGGHASSMGGPVQSDELFQFLAAEAVADLSPELVRFLKHTSVLPELSPDLCDAVLGAKGSRRLLAESESRILFVTRVGGDGAWYRCHPLFRTFLQSQLKAEDQSLYRDLGLRAASILESEGRAEEGLDLLLELEAWPQAAEAVARVAPRLAEQGKWQALDSALDTLPPAAVEGPELTLWRARTRFQMEDPESALRLSRQALQAAETSGQAAAAVQALLISGEVLRHKGDVEGALERFQKALEHTTEAGLDETFRAEALRQLGTSHGMTGDLSAAVAELEEAMRLYEAAGELHRVASISDALGYCHSAQSRWHEAHKALERARVAWEQLGNLADLAATLNNLGVLQYQRGDYQASIEMYEHALKVGHKAGRLSDEAYAAVGMADTQRALSHYDRALKLYREGIELARRMGDGYLLRAATQGLGLTHLYMGDGEQARLCLQEAVAARIEEGPFNRGLDQMVEGQWLLETGRPREALLPLGEAAQAFAGCGAKREECLATFLSARASFEVRRRRQALDLLERAASLTRDLGYERFLEPESWRAQAVVQYAASRNAGGGLYRRLLQAPKARPTPAPPEEPMSTAPGELPLVRAYSLGETRVVVGERMVTDFEWRSEKSREMLFYLLVNRRPLRRDEITADIWPDHPEPKCNSNFHSNLHRLRRAVYLQCVKTEGSRYALNSQGRFWFDIEEFAAKLAEAEHRPAKSDEQAAALEEALSLYRGPFLSEVYSEWAEEIRHRLEDRYLRALTALTTLRFQRREYVDVVDLCERLLASDPYHEEAPLWAMESYAALGDRPAALRAFRRYQERLQSDLGASPPPRMVRLYKHLLAAQTPD